MFNKAALGVLLGLSTRALMEFYVRLKEVDEFGRMSYEDAAELISSGKGTVAQHERLTALTIAHLHAVSDAQNMRVQSFDPNNAEDMARLRELIGGAEENPVPRNPGQYL